MMVELFHPDIEGIKMALVILCVSAVFFCVTIFKMFFDFAFGCGDLWIGLPP